jgi:hypothetical protein
MMNLLMMAMNTAIYVTPLCPPTLGYVSSPLSLLEFHSSSAWPSSLFLNSKLGSEEAVTRP